MKIERKDVLSEFLFRSPNERLPLRVSVVTVTWHVLLSVYARGKHYGNRVMTITLRQFSSRETSLEAPMIAVSDLSLTRFYKSWNNSPNIA